MNRDSITNNHNEPLVSVIVVTYMQQHLIKYCLDSVFMQNYPNLELIITDDCSADYDEEWLRRYIQKNKNNNIKQFIISQMPVNRGPSANAKNGIDVSSGDYFVLLSGDDMLMSDEVISEAVKLFNNPKINVRSGRSKACNYDGSLADHLYPAQWAFNSVVDADALTQFNLLATQSTQYYFDETCMFFRRSFYDSLGGFTTDYYQSIWPFLLKMTDRGNRITVVDKVLSIRRYGGYLNQNDDIMHESKKMPYYNDCVSILSSLALPVFLKKGETKKIVRCRHAIWCAKNHILNYNWHNLGLFDQTIWKIKNAKEIFLAFLYAVRNGSEQIKLLNKSSLVALAIAFFVFYFSTTEKTAYVGALVFFIICLWIIIRYVLLFLIKTVLRMRRG